MPFWNCYYHIIWATKGRQAIIDETFEPVIVAHVERVCVELKCHLIAQNNVSDHVHVACAIPPSLAVARVISQIKGATSHEINSAFDRDSKFQWQESYGVLTFGQKNLDFVRDYIFNQKQHHANNSLYQILERIE